MSRASLHTILGHLHDAQTCVHAIVIALAVSTDRPEVDNDRLRAFNAASLD